MSSLIRFSNASTQFPPPAELARQDAPVEVVLPYTNAALTAHALQALRPFVEGLHTPLTIMAVHVVPFPAPLEASVGIRARLECELAAVARACSAPVRVSLVFARDWQQAYLSQLPRRSLVVIAAANRWWQTREEKLAKRLAREGYAVTVIKGN